MVSVDVVTFFYVNHWLTLIFCIKYIRVLLYSQGKCFKNMIHFSEYFIIVEYDSLLSRSILILYKKIKSSIYFKYAVFNKLS